MDIALQYFPNVLLIFCRITSFFVVSPIFSFKGLSTQYKIGLAVFVTLLTLMSIGLDEAIPVDGNYILFILREILVGLIIGFTAYLFFTVVQIAGAFVDLQMGFGMANMMDPITGVQSPILGNFKYMLAITLFLIMNGHHLLLRAIMESYEWIPLSNELFSNIYNGSISTFITSTFTNVFVLAFQMTAPLIAVLFLVDVALGMLARTAPQFNLFVIGIPIKIMIGLFVLFTIVTGFAYLYEDLFDKMFTRLEELIMIID
ncbi:flagellar biosynthetic protein FliR [Chengkuizengella sp. 2205SS18-9]|uniref:Flagellar biosynthetic protein FliR n=1 Tax=Chengkuizengella axinellae TaxID=3064388 RepID=A0ABT9IVS8_9BACL|nr:flagellar biosynthetic protein FliR [Chengkuizengella sp. 2205SS18-9]MDP5273455.1 flagellar biosynthetic protein FliR [Chengkuizengella sp. 2205SS18-9]